MLLDLDKLAKAEAEDWILRWGQALPGTNARMLSLSRGGSDAVAMREFDVANKAFVADGFALPEAKGSAEWLDADTLLLSSAYGEDMSTVSGYARTVRLWRRGTGVDHALVIFETVSDSMQVYSSVDGPSRNLANQLRRLASDSVSATRRISGSARVLNVLMSIRSASMVRLTPAMAQWPLPNTGAATVRRP